MPPFVSMSALQCSGSRVSLWHHSPPHPAPIYYYISQTGCQDPGCKSVSISSDLWDPGRTRVGPGSDPGNENVIISSDFWDPGRTRVGPGSHPGYENVLISSGFWDPGRTRVRPVS